jgi:hypothetical protein
MDKDQGLGCGKVLVREDQRDYENIRCNKPYNFSALE